MTGSKYDFLKKQMKGNYRYLFTSVFFILIGSFFSFLGPKLIGVAVDSIIGTDAFDLPVFVVDIINRAGGRDYFLENIWVVIFVFLAIKITEAFCEFMRLGASNYLGENLGYNMRQSIFERLQSATFAYHKGIYTGDIIQRCSTDIDTVRMFVLEMTDIIRVVSKIVIAYWFMTGISLPLALISFTTVPLVSAFSVYFTGKIQKRFLAADEAEGALQSRVQENLSAPRVVRAFGKQKQERDLFEKGNNLFTDMWTNMGNLMAWFWAIGDLLPVLQVILVLSSGTFFAVKGFITPGQIISFMVYNNMLAWPIRSLGRIFGNMAKATVSLGRINEVYNAPQEDYDSGIDMEIKGDIEFKDVSFSFGKQKLFENLSFTVPAGQTVAILGASGSGKSTILALLARFYDVDSGRITIDGVNIKEWDIKEYHKNFAAVFQDFSLFGATLGENVSMDAKPHKERVEEAVKAADFNRTLPDGTDSILLREFDDEGVSLSGGEAQKIAIARAFYKNCAFAILDEPSANLDPVAEYALNQSMTKAANDKTVLFISHRLSTTIMADEIYMLEKGEIIEHGSHEELMKLDGKYAYMFKLQAEKYN